MKFRLLESSRGFYITTYNPETKYVYYWGNGDFTTKEADAYIFHDLPSCLHDLPAAVTKIRDIYPYGNISRVLADNMYAVEIGTGKAWKGPYDSGYHVDIANPNNDVDVISFDDIDYDQELTPLTMDFFD